MQISRQSIRRLINEEIRRILREGASGISGNFEIVDPEGNMPRLAYFVSDGNRSASGNVVGSQSLLIAISTLGSSLKGEKKSHYEDWGSPDHQDWAAKNAAGMWANQLNKEGLQVSPEELKKAFLDGSIAIVFKEPPRNYQSVYTSTTDYLPGRDGKKYYAQWS